jgi:hypothetical protein
VVRRREEENVRIFGSGLPVDTLRGIHARILRTALQRAAKDGLVTENEASELRRVASFLQRLGWTP